MTTFLLVLVIVLVFAVAFLSGFLLGSRRRRIDPVQLRSDLRAMTTEMAQAESEQIRKLHRDTLLEMLDPLDRDLQTFHRKYVEGNAEMRTHIEHLLRQTRDMGSQAEELSRALRGNSKMQGNWGEGILARILEVSGLEEGVGYEKQVSVAGEQGRLQPDVVVHLPEGGELVIDAKVSLTAFVEYANEANPADSARLLRKHVESLRQHINELAAKHYEKAVDGAVGFVLMFVPNEAAYVAALTERPELSLEAYKKNIILVNPTNLLMSLQLVYHLWQSERRNKNVAEIYASAEKLYKKFTLFAEGFVRMGDAIDALRRTYDQAESRLRTGRDNIIGQLEGWKRKGLTPSADIPRRLKDAETQDAITFEVEDAQENDKDEDVSGQ